MGIAQICKTISNLFNNVRPPFPQLSRLLLVCSMVRRPGLSTIHSTANAVKDIARLGIPTGKSPAGCDNLSIGITFSVIDEIFRAFKHDASIQVGLQPQSMFGNAVGGNGGGTAVLTGGQVNAGFAVGVMN